MFKWIDKTFIKPVEESKMPLGVFVLFAYAYIFIRTVLEGSFEFLHTMSMVHAPATLASLEDMFLHFPLFYFMIYVVAILLLSLVTGHDTRKVSRVVLIYSFVILIPPLVDPLFRSAGYRLLYPLQSDFQALLDIGRDFIFPWRMFSAEQGVTGTVYGSSPGMALEAYAGVILSMVFCGLRGPTKARKIAGIFLAIPAICIAMLCGGLPATLAGFLGGGPAKAQIVYLASGLIKSRSLKTALALILPFLPIAGVWLWLYSREKMRLLWRSLDPLRVILSGLAGPAGYLMAWIGFRPVLASAPSNPFDYLAIPGLAFMGVVVGSWITALMQAHDSSRGEAERQSFRQASFALIIFSFASAWSLGYTSLYLAGIAMIMGALTAVPPIRLERFLVPASLAKALSVFLLVLAGYSLFADTCTLNVFPWQLFLGVFLPLWAVFVLWELISRGYLKAKQGTPKEGKVKK